MTKVELNKPPLLSLPRERSCGEFDFAQSPCGFQNKSTALPINSSWTNITEKWQIYN
jgi:hypothetical protein